MRSNQTVKTKDSDSSHRDFLSVVIPCFNEEETISQTYHQLVATLNKDPMIDFELVFVDDGSDDSTLVQLQEFHHTDDCVKIVVLSRNFGHQMALTAGLDHAKKLVMSWPLLMRTFKTHQKLY